MIHSELRALYSYWNRLRAGRKTPLRSDIDPRDMDCDARNLFILENLGRGNIRFRLAGTSIIDAFGMELRGMNARSIMASASRESFTALISETLEDPGVGYARLRDAAEDRNVWEVNLLPLRSDFGVIDRIIGCLHPLTGVTGRQTGIPLRFRIEQMSVEAIEATVHEIEPPAHGSHARPQGFAEQPTPFQSRGGPRSGPPSDDDGRSAPRLTPIEGGGDDDGRKPPRRPGGGGHLRLVKK